MSFLNLEDEYARIEVAEGKVIQWNQHHVLGVLAMSKSISCCHGAVEVIEMSRKAWKHLMISSTVESKIATDFARHLAVGIQSFVFVCLDMPFLLSKDSVVGGYQVLECKRSRRIPDMGHDIYGTNI